MEYLLASATLRYKLVATDRQRLKINLRKICNELERALENICQISLMEMIYLRKNIFITLPVKRSVMAGSSVYLLPDSPGSTVRVHRPHPPSECR